MNGAPFPLTPFAIGVFPESWLPDLHAARGQKKYSAKLIGGSALANASYGCVHHAVILSPNGKKSPLSLQFLLGARRGLGKTFAYDYFSEATRQHSKLDEARYEHALATFRTDMLTWQLEMKGLEKAFIRATQSGKPNDQLREAVRKHDAKKPAEPARDRKYLQVMSFPGYLKVMRGSNRRVFIGGSDARSILRSGMMKRHDAHCLIWDEDEFISDGAYASVHIHDANQVFLLVTQPEFALEFMHENGGEALTSGFMDRTLVAMVSNDDEDDPSNDSNADEAHPGWMSRRLAQLLIEADSRRQLLDFDRTVLSFSPEAVDLWKRREQEIERRASTGDLVKIAGFAAKFMDNVSRIAGTFHYFSGYEGQVSLETLERALIVATWFMNEHQKLFDKQEDAADIPEQIRDAWSLFEHLHTRCFPHTMAIKCNWLANRWKVRGDRYRTDAALRYLFRLGIITIRDEWLSKKPTKVIHLNPSAFSQFDRTAFRKPIPTLFRGGHFPNPDPSLERTNWLHAVTPHEILETYLP